MLTFYKFDSIIKFVWLGPVPILFVFTLAFSIVFICDFRCVGQTAYNGRPYASVEPGRRISCWTYVPDSLADAQLTAYKYDKSAQNKLDKITHGHASDHLCPDSEVNKKRN